MSQLARRPARRRTHGPRSGRRRSSSPAQPGATAEARATIGTAALELAGAGDGASAAARATIGTAALDPAGAGDGPSPAAPATIGTAALELAGAVDGASAEARATIGTAAPDNGLVASTLADPRYSSSRPPAGAGGPGVETWASDPGDAAARPGSLVMAAAEPSAGVLANRSLAGSARRADAAAAARSPPSRSAAAAPVCPWSPAASSRSAPTGRAARARRAWPAVPSGVPSEPRGLRSPAVRRRQARMPSQRRRPMERRPAAARARSPRRAVGSGQPPRRSAPPSSRSGGVDRPARPVRPSTVGGPSDPGAGEKDRWTLSDGAVTADTASPATTPAGAPGARWWPRGSRNIGRWRVVKRCSNSVSTVMNERAWTIGISETACQSVRGARWTSDGPPVPAGGTGRRRNGHIATPRQRPSPSSRMARTNRVRVACSRSRTSPNDQW